MKVKAIILACSRCSRTIIAGETDPGAVDWYTEDIRVVPLNTFSDGTMWIGHAEWWHVGKTETVCPKCREKVEKP